MSEQPKVAYGIGVIQSCIARDTDVSKKFNAKGKKDALYRKKKKLLDKHREIKEMIDLKFVKSLNRERGKYVNKVDWIPSELLITDSRIQGMCRNLFTYSKIYQEKTGLSFGPCPGFNTMSACPPFSPSPEKTRAKLDKADIFIAIQSKYFIEPPEIAGWHDFLINKFKKEIEKVEGTGSVTVTFGAGPCQVCRPQPCLGGGDCRVPKKRIFALESSGVPVGRLCEDMALMTGNGGWKIRWIKYIGTPGQTSKRWKTTAGLAVKLNGKKK
jgi:hypothetical protein